MITKDHKDWWRILAATGPAGGTLAKACQDALYLLARAERAEVERDDYRERAEKAEAAIERVRRVAQVWVDIRPTHPTASDAGHGIAYAGQQILDALAIPEAPGGES